MVPNDSSVKYSAKYILYIFDVVSIFSSLFNFFCQPSPYYCGTIHFCCHFLPGIFSETSNAHATSTLYFNHGPPINFRLSNANVTILSQILPFQYWHTIPPPLLPVPPSIRYSYSMPQFPDTLTIYRGGDIYHINISITKNISSREVHIISVIVKHRSREVGGSYDVLYILSHVVDIIQPSARIEQNVWFPHNFHLPLNHFIIGIYYWKDK